MLPTQCTQFASSRSPHLRDGKILKRSGFCATRSIIYLPYVCTTWDVVTCISLAYVLRGYMYQPYIWTTWVHISISLAWVLYVWTCIADIISLTYEQRRYLNQPCSMWVHVSALHMNYVGTCINSWVYVSALRMKYVGTCISLTYELRGYLYALT